MLILSRKEGEVLVIDNKIFLTILSIKGSQVRVGIDAPDEVSIDRLEIFMKKKLDRKDNNIDKEIKIK